MFVRDLRKNHNKNAPLTSDDKNVRAVIGSSCTSVPVFVVNSVVGGATAMGGAGLVMEYPPTCFGEGQA
jgi:hypothetical protein